MKKSKQEPVGSYHCKTCDQTAQVIPLAKQPTNQIVDGHDAYFTRCGCGTDQRRGKARQKRIIALMNVEAPPVLPVEAPQAPSLPAVINEDEPKQEPKPKPKKNKAGLWWLTLPVVAVAVIAGNSLRAKKGS